MPTHGSVQHTHWTNSGVVQAECRTCAWEVEGRQGAVGRLVRKHVLDTGHTVASARSQLKLTRRTPDE